MKYVEKEIFYLASFLNFKEKINISKILITLIIAIKNKNDNI
jgi:hypothetical protein